MSYVFGPIARSWAVFNNRKPDRNRRKEKDDTEISEGIACVVFELLYFVLIIESPMSSFVTREK